MIGEHPEDPSLRALVHIKHNLSERGATLLYELAGGDRAKRKVPKVKWRGTCELGPEDFARAAGKPGRPDNLIQGAMDFLERALAGGPRSIKAVLSDGEKRGHTGRTLRRASERLEVVREGQSWKLAKMSP
jgi:hypothetical protein